MKPYVKIDMVPSLVAQISDEINDYVSTHTNYYQTGALGWQFLNTIELLSQCPELLKFFKEKNLLVRNSAITISINNDQLPIHIDEAPVIAKINFPVAYTAGWVNRWYKISEEQLAQCPRVLNQFKKEIIDLSGIKEAEVIAELQDMKHPIVFNSSIPHSVIKLSDSIIAPRVVASFTFHKEPLEWLK